MFAYIEKNNENETKGIISGIFSGRGEPVKRKICCHHHACE
jgi:hypothetical protein